MARFGDNPIKTPLDGTELLAGEDAGTNLDICVTPAGLKTYVYNNLPVAPASFPGLISSADYTKLNNLPTFDQYNTINGRLAQQALGFFIAVPADGFVRFFSNPTTASLVIRGVRYATSAGSVTLQLSINGTPIPGFEAIAVTTTPTGVTAGGTPILEPNQDLEFTLSSTSGAQNLFFSIATTVAYLG